MFYVYILQSLKWNRYYVGQTKSIEDRIDKHNNGGVKSTKNGVPWILILESKVETRLKAIALERKIKKRGAKRYLEDLLNG